MEMRIYKRHMENGTYFLDCGYAVDMTGSIYYHEKDMDKFNAWFHENMWSEGFTTTCGGKASPHSKECDSEGLKYDRVVTIKHHTENRKQSGSSLGELEVLEISI